MAVTACQDRHETPRTHLGRPLRLGVRRPAAYLYAASWVSPCSATIASTSAAYLVDEGGADAADLEQGVGVGAGGAAAIAVRVLLLATV